MNHVRHIKPGEALAIDPRAMVQTRDAFFWMLGPGVAANERQGDVAIVHVRGSLEHHADGYGDSYEAICGRVCEALRGDVDEDAGEGAEGQPPKALVLRIDSMGGVVSGLNETVAAIRRTCENASVKLYAYVDELAASAAYAIACAASEVYLPASAICGSIGVIATMPSQAGYDKKQGFDFAILTSGKRKADGHVHAPITDDAKAAEQARVDRLARQFFKLAGRARGLSPAKIQGYEAGLFLGIEAVRAGLADGVLSWEAFLELAQGATSEQKPLANGARSASPSTSTAQAGASRTETVPMSTLMIANLIAQTEAALSKEKDPAKLAALAADLAAYKKTKHTIEKHEEESGDEDEDEDEDEKGNETDRKEDDDAPPPKGDDDDGDGDDDDEEEEEEEDEESEEEEEAAAKKAAASIARLGASGKPLRLAIRKAMRDQRARLRVSKGDAKIAAHVRQVTKKKGAAAAIGALRGMLAAGASIKEDVATLKRDAAKTKKDAVIDGALAKRRITKHEAKSLRGEPLSFVEKFLALRPKAIINSTEDALSVPDGDLAAGLSAAATKQIDEAVKASGKTGKEADVLRDKIIAEVKKIGRTDANGRI